MKPEFDSVAAPETLHFDLRWPYAENKEMSPRGMRAGENPWRDVKLADISAVAIAAPFDKTLGYATVYLIVEGQEPFMTFLDKQEEAALRKALASRNLQSLDTKVARPGDLRFFDEAPESTVLIDPSRIRRMFDPLTQHNDYLLFRVVFGNNAKLDLSVNEPDFDSEAVLKANPTYIPENETERHKWYREADEGTLIGEASKKRIDNQRRVLNTVLETLAPDAPQLYKVENTQYPFYTRASDIEDVLHFTGEGTGARLTFNKDQGNVYGHNVTETLHFKTREDAVAGIEKLRQRMSSPAQKPASAATPR